MTRFSSKKIQRGNLRIISVAWQNSSGVSFAHEVLKVVLISSPEQRYRESFFLSAFKW